jgi:ribosome-associated toxin RatA of RatAB toxin-antitoxin module
MSDPTDTPIDAATRARLDRGEVLVEALPVPGAPTPMIFVRAIIEAPVAEVWRHIEQSSRYAEFMPRIKQCAELSREGEHVRTRMTVDMPFPLKNLTATTRVRHTVEPDGRHVRQWRLEEGDYHQNEGSWTLTPFEGHAQRTLAVYRAQVVPKIPIPKAIQSAIQEKAMPKLIEALRERTRAFMR